MVHAEVTVAAIVRRADRYLMVEEIAHGRRVINQPAGHVEPGETLIEAAIRETREESRWRLNPTGFIGLYYWPHDDGRITLRVALAGDVDDWAAERPLDEDIVDTHWFDIDTLSARTDLRSPLVMRSIHDYERYGPMPLERIAHVQARA